MEEERVRTMVNEFKRLLMDMFVDELRGFETAREVISYLSLIALLVVPIGASVYLWQELQRRKRTSSEVCIAGFISQGKFDLSKLFI